MSYRYLTISEDLQIVPNEGWKFSPVSYGLEHAEADVTVWLEKNPAHARREEAERWLEAAQDQILVLQTMRELRTKELAKEAERKMVRDAVRKYLWSRKVKFADLKQKTEELTERIMQQVSELG